MDSAWMGVVWRNLCNRVGFELGPQGQWPTCLMGMWPRMGPEARSGGGTGRIFPEHGVGSGNNFMWNSREAIF